MVSREVEASLKDFVMVQDLKSNFGARDSLNNTYPQRQFSNLTKQKRQNLEIGSHNRMRMVFRKSQREGNKGGLWRFIGIVYIDSYHLRTLCCVISDFQSSVLHLHHSSDRGQYQEFSHTFPPA